MTSKVLFVVNIDGDPDPETTPPDNPAVMLKYAIMKRIVDDHAGGKGSFCVQTSPMYRRRFFESPFIDFWHEWVKGGGISRFIRRKTCTAGRKSACPWAPIMKMASAWAK